MKRFAVASLAVSALAAAAVALGSACSSSSSSSNAPASCTSDPLSCPTGQTCWPISTAPTFGCIASSSSGFSAACENTLGVATCGDKMTCDEAAGDAGRCTFYCAAQNGCPPNYECHATHAGGATGPTIQVCRAATDDGGVLGIDNSGDGGSTVIIDSDAAIPVIPDAMVLPQ